MNLRAEVIQDRYRVPASQKCSCKMCSNETRATGDEYLQVAIAFVWISRTRKPFSKNLSKPIHAFTVRQGTLKLSSLRMGKGVSTSRTVEMNACNHSIAESRV